MHPFPDRIDTFVETEVKPLIAKHGWYAQGVFGTAARRAPSFVYTIGMTPAGLPELLIVGLPIALAHQILSCAVHMHTGTEITDGDEVDLGFSVKFRAATVAPLPVARLFGIAHRVYPAQVISAIQLMFPDEHGRFPGEDGCEFNDRSFTADELAAEHEKKAP